MCAHSTAVTSATDSVKGGLCQGLPSTRIGVLPCKLSHVWTTMWTIFSWRSAVVRGSSRLRPSEGLTTVYDLVISLDGRSVVYAILKLAIRYAACCCCLTENSYAAMVSCILLAWDKNSDRKHTLKYLYFQSAQSPLHGDRPMKLVLRWVTIGEYRLLYRPPCI